MQTTTHLHQAGQIAGPKEWMLEHWLTSQLRRTPGSSFPAQRAPFESENRSMRNRRTLQQATPRPRDRSSTFALDYLWQGCVRCLLPTRGDEGEDVAPGPKSQDKATLE